MAMKTCATRPAATCSRAVGNYAVPMQIRGITPILNVSDVPASVLWFEKLGWRRSFTHNDAGMIANAALSNAHGPAGFAGLCADPDSDQFGGVWMSWWIPDADAAHAECVAAGVEIVRPPVNEPWGVREFLIRHPDGHIFRVSGPVI